jgi:hypothetical protein
LPIAAREEIGAKTLKKREDGWDLKEECPIAVSVMWNAQMRNVPRLRRRINLFRFVLLQLPHLQITNNGIVHLCTIEGIIVLFPSYGNVTGDYFLPNWRRRAARNSHGIPTPNLRFLSERTPEFLPMKMYNQLFLKRLQ